jgi:hypothetical protein
MNPVTGSKNSSGIKFSGQNVIGLRMFTVKNIVESSCSLN